MIILFLHSHNIPLFFAHKHLLFSRCPVLTDFRLLANMGFWLTARFQLNSEGLGALSQSRIEETRVLPSLLDDTKPFESWLSISSATLMLDLIKVAIMCKKRHMDWCTNIQIVQSQALLTYRAILVPHQQQNPSSSRIMNQAIFLYTIMQTPHNAKSIEWICLG